MRTVPLAAAAKRGEATRPARAAVGARARSERRRIIGIP
jgi:hypothetical protein